MAPRQLSPADQRLSERAAEAAMRSNFDQRAGAHRLASRLAAPAEDEVSRRLEYASAYGAALLLMREDVREEPDDVDVRALAAELTALHHRHDAIVAANRRDFDGLG